MFRRAFSTVSRIAVTGIGAAKGSGGGRIAGIGLGAGLFSAATAVAIQQGTDNMKAAVAASDTELKKRPNWYQETVKHLENVIQKLSVYSYIEDPVLIDDALDILQRVEDVNNAEVSWRLGRMLVEKGNLFPKKEANEKLERYEAALKHLSKALQMDPNSGNAHKWYAIALAQLKWIAPGNALSKKATPQIIEHLEKARQLAPKDALIPHLLGIQHYEQGNYEECIKQMRVSEQIMPNLLIGNKAYQGMALAKQGKKDESVNMIKQALQMPIKHRADRKHKATARSFLFLKYNMKIEPGSY